MRATAFCLVIIAGLSGCGIDSTKPDRGAAADVLKLGGKIEVDERSYGQPVTKVHLHGTKVTDADLSKLESLTQLKSLSLGRTQITDAGLVHLRDLRSLQTLSLNLTAVTDAGIQNLCLLKNLRTLNVQDTLVTEQGVRDLKKMLPQVAIGYTKSE